MLKKLGLISLAAASAFAMHTFEININEKDLGISAKFDLGQYNESIEPGTTFIGAKYLQGSVDNGDFEKEESFSEINFLKVKEVSNTGISLGLGVKANDTKNFRSVPLGFEVVYALPNVKTIPITLNGSFYYAPEVLTSKDGDHFSEFGLNARFEVIENGLVVVGYRKIDTTYVVGEDDTKTLTYNDSAYVGFKFAF